MVKGPKLDVVIVDDKVLRRLQKNGEEADMSTNNFKGKSNEKMSAVQRNRKNNHVHANRKTKHNV